ncbi:MAG TPA: VCBS repeat-containing protein, partial [Phycisphaerae bacterium]|nr:VCBS repeat-containing protein [Phycisphaerae bacterium]
MRCVWVAIGTVMMGILWLAGCVETGDESTVDLPTTTQPAAVNNAPAYHIALVDPLYESTAGAKAVAVGDINNDGVMDFASISSESQRVQIHLQDPLIGTFDTIAIAGGAPITRPTAIELADLNGDGKLDVIV